jgi:hypothetical protein
MSLCDIYFFRFNRGREQPAKLRQGIEPEVSLLAVVILISKPTAIFFLLFNFFALSVG